MNIQVNNIVYLRHKKFQISFHFRAIDIQALIGTIGGYIGLFLGYSVLQIPSMLALLICRTNKWFSEKFSTSRRQFEDNLQC